MSVGWCGGGGGGGGGGGKADLQMSQVPIRTEDAVYKSQWPIQKMLAIDIPRKFSKK